MIGSYVIICAALFAIGCYGVLTRRNLIIILMSIEVMINGAALLFAAAARGGTLGTAWEAGAMPSHGGHIFVLVIMAVAAAEAAGIMGLTPEQVERVYHDIDRKRATTLPLHLTGLLVGEVPEIQK